MKTTVNYFSRMLCVFLLSVGVALTSCEEEPQPIAVQSVSLDKTSIEITVGETLKLIATVAPDNADNPAVAWTSSDPGVASVQDGIVTAHKEGRAKITVRTNDGGKTATCDVTVIPKTYPVESVSLDKTSYEMAIGDEVTLTATVTPDNATNKSVTWSSSDIAVATVDNGKVTAVSPGEATITVTTEDGGKTAICKVTVKADPVVFALDKVTAATASFSGHLNVPAADLPYCQITVYYSDDETFNINDALSASVTSFDSEQNFTISLTDLKHDTRYNYCIVAEVKSEKIYGEVLDFTTKSLSVELTVNENPIISDEPIAEFRGRVIGLLPEEKDYTKFGVAYSSVSDELKSNESNKIFITEFASDNSFDIESEPLSIDTKYYYCVFRTQGETYTYFDVSEFQTLHPYSAPADLDVSYASDLSSSASANCYIVSETGFYKFRTVKGNSEDIVGNVASASILWETFGTDIAPERFDLIREFCCKDGYIAFKTADTFKEGNALIAAKDADGNILWSWHIWFTDQPSGQVYYNDAGTMMDRNLGATSATPRDVGAFGLLYQWGRKDPFLSFASISGYSVVKSTISWPSEVSSNSNNGTIDYATAHPTTIISSDGDWCYTESSSADNPRWTTSEMTKSIYDPCPVGWRVPDGGPNGVWATALKRSDWYSEWFKEIDLGIDFGWLFGLDETIWYPAGGARHNYISSDVGWSRVGEYGYYWSATPSGSDTHAYELELRTDISYVDLSGSGYRSDSKYVRCIKE